MKRISTCFFLLLLAVGSLFSQGLEDWYAALSQFAGIDPNAGRATMLTLVIPSGGMYQAMGTAYTAVLKDSGYIEANPAGSALLKETELSLYHNDWIGDSRIESAVFTIRQGDFGLGFGGKFLYIPFTAIDTWGERYKNSGSSDYAKGYYTEFVGTLNASYTLFSNFYFHGITLGANLKTAYRGVPDVIASGQSALGFMVDLGAVTKFNLFKFYPSRERNFSVGVAFRNLGPPVMGDPLPASMVWGLAYSPWRPLTISTDVKVPMALTDHDFGIAGSGSSEKISYALGTNVAITGFWAIQGGLELKPGRPRLSMGSTVNIEKLTFNVNYVVDLMTTLQPFDRISVEVKLNLGDLGRQEAQDRARELYVSGLEFYAKGSLKEAISDWEKALTFDPNFQPARDMIDTAKRALDLQGQMESKQKIEQ